MTYEPKSNEEAAYKCGLNGEIPIPQVILSDSMLEAWKHGMDDRDKLNQTVLLAKNDLFSTYWATLAFFILCCSVASVTTYFVIKICN